eukprot:jgi/Tetstr1/447122/TSEL_034560.t1
MLSRPRKQVRCKHERDSTLTEELGIVEVKDSSTELLHSAWQEQAAKLRQKRQETSSSAGLLHTSTSHLWGLRSSKVAVEGLATVSQVAKAGREGRPELGSGHRAPKPLSSTIITHLLLHRHRRRRLLQHPRPPLLHLHARPPVPPSTSTPATSATATPKIATCATKATEAPKATTGAPATATTQQAPTIAQVSPTSPTFSTNSASVASMASTAALSPRSRHPHPHLPHFHPQVRPFWPTNTGRRSSAHRRRPLPPRCLHQSPLNPSSPHPSLHLHHYPHGQP